MSLDNLILELQDLKENFSKYIDRKFFRKISRNVPVPFNGQINRVGMPLGYERMWFAEHHNTTSIASSAPEISVA